MWREEALFLMMRGAVFIHNSFECSPGGRLEGYLLEGAKLLPQRGTLTAPACIFLTYVGLHLILHMQ